MGKKILDIKAVQSSKEELFNALNDLKTNDIVIFENAIIELKIGEKKITDKIFDCVIYSEESGRMVLIMKNTSVSTNDVIEFFDNNNIPYNFVSFIKDKNTYEEKVTTPSIWFAYNMQDVKDACTHSLNSGITDFNYIFDKTIESRLKFHYITSSDRNKITFDGKIRFYGLIKLDDKIILIAENLHYITKSLFNDIEKYLTKKGFIESVDCYNL